MPAPDKSSPPPPKAPASFGRRLVRGVVLLVVVVLVVGGLLLWLFNRAFTSDKPVTHASRLTAGNHLFPEQVAVFPDHVSRYKPRLFGHVEDAITLRQIASVKVVAGPVFADLVIDTTGGSPPVVIHGLWKKDAVALSSAIAAAQSALPMPVTPVPAAASPTTR